MLKVETRISYNVNQAYDHNNDHPEFVYAFYFFL